MELLREMSQKGLVGVTSTYSSIIQRFFQSGDCENAQGVFNLEIMIYNILLDGFYNNGQLGYIP